MMRYTPEYGQVQVIVANNQIIFRNTIASDYQLDSEMLMDAFYRPDFSRNRTSGGSGLGLYIVKQLAQHYDWKVEIKILETQQMVEIKVTV